MTSYTQGNRGPISTVARSGRSLNLGFILCAAIVLLLTAMVLNTRSGRANAGIGQPVSFGPPQAFAAGSGPYALISFTNDFGLPTLAAVNNSSDSISVFQKTSFSDQDLLPATNYSLPAGAHPQSVVRGIRRPFFSNENFLVVADTGINKVSVLLNQFPNSFQTPVNYDVGVSPQGVALGHLTNDSNLDIVTANFGSNNVSLLSGNADGTFGTASSFNVSAGPRSVVVQPLNNDFSSDVATCNSGTNPGKVNVLIGSNNGTFQAPVTYDVGVDPYFLAAADVDGDAKFDLVTANNGSNDVSVLLNDGNNGFKPAVSYPAGLGPRSVTVQDLNLDGKPDLAVASAGNGLNLLLNNGDGTFRPPVNFSMGQNPFGVAVGFFNNDGIPDVATANNGDGTVTVRINTTVPLLTFPTPTPYPVSSHPHSIAAFSRFGKPALAVTNNDVNDSGVSVLYGINSFGQGNFGSPTTYPLLAGSQPQGIVVGNLGQISLPSLVIALPNAAKVAILLGNSDDSFQPPVYRDVGIFPEAVALGDFNGDGNLDIAAANYGNSTISILVGNSNRTFQDAITLPNVMDANPEFIVTGDFNGDGKTDLATCNSGPPDHNKVNVLLGNGNATFQPVVAYTVGASPYFMTTGDFNGDGKLDLAVSNSVGSNVSVLLNNGSGIFQQPASDYPVGSRPNSIATGDFNLDGITDLAVTNGQGKTFSTLLGNGNGTFKAALDFPVGQGPIGITVGDFNVDGKPDVASADYSAGTISVVINDNTAPPPAPPPNDNFANAETLTGISGRINGTNIGATVEPNEPLHGGSQNFASVWYSWTAPANGGMTIDTFESNFDTSLAVYTGTNVGTLTQLASNDNEFSIGGDLRRTSKVKFTAVSGTTYKIAVDGGKGNIFLNWFLLPPPANDNFASAQIITGAFGVATSTNAGATKEQGEPNHADNPGGASLWYRWTAPNSGDFTFKTSSSKISCNNGLPACRYDTLLAIYTGSTLQEISIPQNLVAKNDDESPQAVTSSVTFTAVGGTTYQIAVDSKGSSKSDIVLSWFSGSASDGNFANAVLISGSSGGIGSEVAPNGEAWFRWVAPGTGLVTFSSGIFFSPTKTSFQYPSTLTTYSVNGQSLSSAITSNTGPCQVSFGDRFCQSSSVTFGVVAQTTYAIQVLRPLEATGGAFLSWSLSGGPANPPPANDNFLDAKVISGFGSSTSFNNTNATKETNEPNHGGDPGGHSLWFNWSAPETFEITFSTSPFSGQTIFLGIYTGSTVASLAPVGGGSGSATFSAVKDTTYHIAVDSLIQGSANLNWRPSNAPPNDNFADAIIINGSSGKILGTNFNATSEIGEPSSSASSSVWYSWIAPTDGTYTFNTDGSDFNTILAIYVGPSVNSLSPVIFNDDETSGFPQVITSRVTFFALAGQTYKVAIAGVPGFSFPQGTIGLHWGAPLAIGGRITDIKGVGIANTMVSISGDAARTRLTNSQGFYNFPDLVQGGSYVVTPDTASFTFDFTNRTYNSLAANVTDANFVAQTPTYSIAGRLVANGIGVGNVNVSLTGTNIPPGTFVSTTNDGFYQFANLTTNGDYTVTPSSSLYTFNAVYALAHSYTFNNLNANVPGADFAAIAVPKTLTINSVNPNSGVMIAISPNDNGAQGAGATPLMRVYNDSTVVTLTAPTTAGGNNFQKWLKDGSDFANNQLATVSVTMDANHAMTAVYLTPTRTLTVASSNPNTGVNITVTPNDNGSHGNGATPLTRIYNINTTVSLTAPATVDGNNFQKWLKDGAEFSNNQALNVSASMDADHTMTAVYVTPIRTLTVASANPGSGVSITVSPNDNAAQGNGATQFTRTYNNTTVVNLTAPTSASGNNFQKWLKDGSDFANNQLATVSVTMDADHTLTAVYLTPQPSLSLQFSDSNYNAGEDIGSIPITVARSGDTSGAATVNYITEDAGLNDCSAPNTGFANSRCDYETTVGTLHFAVGETAKTILIPVVDDVYAEGSESFTVTLSNATGALLGSPSVATVSIGDNESTTGTNPINLAPFFVRLHYIDFLNREPNASGLAFWIDQITSCGCDPACIEIRRINVSAAFFLSIEFQQTGYLVERLYKAAYGDATGTSVLGGTHQLTVPIVRFNEFLADTQQMGRGVVVGDDGADQILENNKQALIAEFVLRARFTTAYPGSMTATQFVDTLNTNAGGVLSQAERDQLISDLTSMAKSRAQVLRAVAEDPDLFAAEQNRAFVLAQYFGYLRRNPNDSPEPTLDYSGYDFWLSKLNQFNGNFVNAEMVKSFIISGEYKLRFGP